MSSSLEHRVRKLVLSDGRTVPAHLLSRPASSVNRHASASQSQSGSRTWAVTSISTRGSPAVGSGSVGAGDGSSDYGVAYSRPRHNYINVEPVKVARAPGGVIMAPPVSRAVSSKPSVDQRQGVTASPTGPTVPAIPQSQDVKQFIKEPSYSTVLQLQREQMSLPPGTTITTTPKAPPSSRRLIEVNPHPVYANCSNYSELDGPRSSDSQGSMDDDHGPNYASPPSPVSSSYSELRQATKYPPGYHFRLLQEQQLHLQQSQQQSTYDSLYEPIQGTDSGPSFGGPKSERDIYKSSSSNSSEYSDFFGPCFQCKHKIIGEGSGCSAMGRIYHLQCFTCHHCHIPLQGQPFYALDGKPFCQDGYMSTLEKCCKCMSPILDRILRATGKPYHPHCFTCLVCQKSLDGVPFTVDATNQIHCIEDFHRRFAPKCSVCQQPIMPEPGQEETVRVVALDRSFHVSCYRCEDCGMILSSDEEGSGCYPLDDHVLCKTCNTRRIQQLTSTYY
ncbi:lipoma-preferred partner homolog [Tigriopus californicus]|uniref:lipoma-preferred partner homolog n=1 Tax=Tigriopus californicus TaxID=6832 RepID=UPI0027DA3E86|nr:lipoma-preferred partner homolog [Tigriopus californicus]